VSTPSFDGSTYQARFDQLAARGVDVHGEAALVLSYAPTTVLDAGCGTGRVGVELARHGVEVVGVDLDASMLAEAQRRAPDLVWVEADLTELDLGRTFDVVVLAGNVPLFTPPGTQDALLEACCRHVTPGGVLIAGFQLGRGYALTAFDAVVERVGAELADRWSTWDRAPFAPDGDYAVSVVRVPQPFAAT
jgi:SAM-dependent methyltransferase